MVVSFHFRLTHFHEYQEMAALSIRSYLILVELFILKISADNVIRKDGYCVMYGQHRPYNGPAKNMSDEQYNLLKSICPYLTVNGKTDTRSCCDLSQLKRLRHNLESASTLLSSCPACYRNFFDVWCELTCSSNQSMSADFENMAFKYYVTNQFSGGLFNSCRDVEMRGGRKVMDLMCGTSAQLCTAEKFLNFIGNPASGAPFLIDFKINQTVDNITSNDFQMKHCNQTFVEEGTGKIRPACSCQSCRDTICSPTSPPPPEKPSNKYVITINATTDFPIDMYQVYQTLPPRNFSGLIHKFILKEILNLHQNISNIQSELNGNPIDLQDVCMKPGAPNNTNCKVESLLQYFQMSETNLDKCFTNMDENCSDPSKIGMDAEDWHDQILGCTRVPAAVSNGNFLKLSCLSTYHAPILPNRVLGNYEKGSYISAKSLILTYFLNDDLNETQQLKKKAWGEAFVKFLNMWQLNHAPVLNLTLSFKHVLPNNGTVNPTSGPSSTTGNTTTLASTTKKSSAQITEIFYYNILMTVFVIYSVLHYGN